MSMLVALQEMFRVRYPVDTTFHWQSFVSKQPNPVQSS